MLGADELQSLLDDLGKVELTCEFCNRAFRYDADDVAAILRGEAPGVTVH
jgi:molecular chaperone Hsp33